MTMIDGHKIGNVHPPFIIAELSANHNGSLSRALKTITEAKRCGASAIKLQTYTPDTMTIDCDQTDFLIKGGLWDGYKLYDLYKWAQTPFEWHKAMFDHARKIGITAFSTPFDETAVDLLEELNTPAYKIASFENTDLPLIRYVASKGKPIIMSTGMATDDQISEAVEAARQAGCNDIILLHCVSSYPAQIEHANIRKIADLASRHGTLTGLSDHTMGSIASIAAVAIGACVIEKHFTLSRQDKGPDSAFSLEPVELTELCQKTKQAWHALGQGWDYSDEIEKPNMIFRRSIYFVKDLAAGSVITKADIRRIRPGHGLEPKYFEALIGRTLRTNVTVGTPTSWDLFDE